MNRLEAEWVACLSVAGAVVIAVFGDPAGSQWPGYVVCAMGVLTSIVLSKQP